MKKVIAFSSIILLASVIGGIYGILHDQLTYTISPEYYTKFKFYQFGLANSGDEAIFPNPRIQVSIVGFMATWWMGLLIGIFLGFFGLIYSNEKQLFRVTFKALILTLIIAITTGLIGLTYGKMHLAKVGVNWWLPENLVDQTNFIAVGSMHNFSYLGGLIGIIAGFIYVFLKRTRNITN